MTKGRGSTRAVDWDRPLRVALDAAEPRPALTSDRSLKKNYAERLSRGIASLFADALRPTYPGVTPRAGGEGQESPVGADRGRKRLDVKVWDDMLGLLVAVSVKTITFRDWVAKDERAGRYTKNMVRNDHELRAEASVIHRRQPYSVLIGCLFLPIDACDDGGAGDRATSSFAHAVVTLRKRTGRQVPTDPAELFERIFVGLFELEGGARGAVRFFDVAMPPPRVGRPRQVDTVSLRAVIDQIRAVEQARNERAPVWGEAEDDELVERLSGGSD